MKKILTILALTGSLLLSTNSFSKESKLSYNALTFMACQNVQMSPVRKPKEVCATYLIYTDPQTGKEIIKVEMDERDKGYLPFQRQEKYLQEQKAWEDEMKNKYKPYEKVSR